MDKVDIAICPEHAIIDEFEYFKVWNAGHSKLKY